MATLGTAGDSLRICWTEERGAAAAYDPANSLGGERLGETIHLKAIIDSPIPPVRVRGFSAITSPGAGYITAPTADTLSYSAPGDDYGVAETIANGETLLLVSANGIDSVRVERVSSDSLGGTMALTLIAQHNGALGMGDVSTAEMLVGEDFYRAHMVHNASPLSITDLKLWINPLDATGVTSDVDQIPGTDIAGVDYYIETSTADAFAGWPKSGWAHINDALGVTREVVYYYERTDVRLTVTGTYHTGLLGTTHSAGTGGDVFYSVPGIRLAKETPSGGAIQAVASAKTAPGGVTWNADITPATGLSEASMAADAELGLWIHREIPLGFSDSVPGPRSENSIGVEWTYDGTTYSGTLSEFYAAPHTAGNVRYYLYVGEDADPDFDADPEEIRSTFPFTYAVTPPGAGNKDINVTVRESNKYRLLSRNTYHRTTTVDSGGNEVASDLALPQGITAADAAGGKVLVGAIYYDDQDASRADTWNLYITTDGTDPNPAVDSPVQVTMQRWGAIRPAYHLRYTTPAYAYGTDFRVIVRVERSSDSAESNNTTVSTLSVGTAPEPQFGDRAWLGLGVDRRLRRAPDSSVTDTVTTDAGNNIYATVTPGVAVFYADTTLVWKTFYDSQRLDKSFIYVPSEWALVNTTISGAGTSDLVETAAWNGTKTLYVATGPSGSRTRKLLIDVTGLELEADSFFSTADMPPVHEPDAIYGYDSLTAFMIFDAATARWAPYLTVNSDGSVRTLIPINQSLTQAQVEAL